MMDLNQLLSACIDRHASDLHLNPGRPPVLRLNGRLVPQELEPLSGGDCEALARELCDEKHWQELKQRGTTDFGLSHKSGNRFRVSVLSQRGGLAAVLRLIPSRLLSVEEIGLPESCLDLLKRSRGLVLVTGPTGSGKTTTLAAMIDWINTHLDRHIVTIEDPIEYLHHHKMSLVTQREVGLDVPDFPEAMVRLLRQDPDVILLGEMRDLKTMASAITAAETGHLVLGTLHTTGTTRTVDRIIDVFPAAQQAQIRTQLSVSIQGVISQLLLPAATGEGRVAAFEVMVMTPAIGNLIRKNETNRIVSTLQTSRRLGMVTLDDYLVDLVQHGTILRQSALDVAQEPAVMEGRLPL